MEKLIIEVRINEYASRKENANVPFSPAEICEESIHCWREGASIIHYHARDPQTGAPSLETAHYAETARLIKDKSDLIIMPTLGAWTLPSPDARMRHIIEMAEDPTTRPDFAPIDMGTSNVDVYDKRKKRFHTEDVIYMNPTKTLRYFAETISRRRRPSVYGAVERQWHPRDRGLRRERHLRAAALRGNRAERIRSLCRESGDGARDAGDG